MPSGTTRISAGTTSFPRARERCQLGMQRATSWQRRLTIHSSRRLRRGSIQALGLNDDRSHARPNTFRIARYTRTIVPLAPGVCNKFHRNSRVDFRRSFLHRPSGLFLQLHASNSFVRPDFPCSGGDDSVISQIALVLGDVGGAFLWPRTSSLSVAVLGLFGPSCLRPILPFWSNYSIQRTAGAGLE
jgi:hypothetical protein